MCSYVIIKKDNAVCSKLKMYSRNLTLLLMVSMALIVGCDSSVDDSGLGDSGSSQNPTSPKETKVEGELTRGEVISLVQEYIAGTCELTESGVTIVDNPNGYRLTDNKDGTWKVSIRNGAIGRWNVNDQDKTVEQVNIVSSLCLNKDGQIPTKTGTSAK